MELIIPTVIYLLFLTYFIVGKLILLLNSNKSGIRGLAILVIALFFAYQIWTLIPFIRNENGKSSTVGWLGLMYFFVTSFTGFALACWALHFFSKKIH